MLRGRAVLHVALDAPRGTSIVVEERTSFRAPTGYPRKCMGNVVNIANPETPRVFPRRPARRTTLPHYSQRYPVTHIPAPNGSRTPILFSHHVKWKCVCRGTNLLCGFVGGGERPVLSLVPY